jgi:hypothetical protein
VDHKWLRTLSQEVKKPTLTAKFALHAPPGGFGASIVAFATAALELQEKRHNADYDPLIRVKTSDAQLAIKTARAALQRLNAASAAEREAFLALLLFAPR